MTVLQSYCLEKGKRKKKKKAVQHPVFVFGHPSKYQCRRAGLNFVERTKLVTVLEVWWFYAERSFLNFNMRKGIEQKISDTAWLAKREQKVRGIWKWELLLALVVVTLQGLTLLSGRNMLLCLWYSNSTLNIFFKCDFLPMITMHHPWYFGPINVTW